MSIEAKQIYSYAAILNFTPSPQMPVQNAQLLLASELEILQPRSQGFSSTLLPSLEAWYRLVTWPSRFWRIRFFAVAEGMLSRCFVT